VIYIYIAASDENRRILSGFNKERMTIRDDGFASRIPSLLR
jgi:hypothetical protein